MKGRDDAMKDQLKAEWEALKQRILSADLSKLDFIDLLSGIEDDANAHGWAAKEDGDESELEI